MKGFNDGIYDNDDNCLNVRNHDQNDSDGDSIGDLCANCPTVSNPFQEDIFPLDGLEGGRNGIGDACEDIPNDIDEDGADNSSDNCYVIPNPDQAGGQGFW